MVTAQRRSESLQDVPISITALTGETLANSGIQQTEQLSTLTPGLLVQRSVVGKISVRGVGNENYTISGDPGVAVHSDGVYVARAPPACSTSTTSTGSRCCAGRRARSMAATPRAA